MDRMTVALVDINGQVLSWILLSYLHSTVPGDCSFEQGTDARQAASRLRSKHLEFWPAAILSEDMHLSVPWAEMTISALWKARTVPAPLCLMRLG
jgi:hypothetical protein